MFAGASMDNDPQSPSSYQAPTPVAIVFEPPQHSYSQKYKLGNIDST